MRPKRPDRARTPLALAAAVLVLAAAAAPVCAHPHVWITNITTFLFDKGRVVGLRLDWTFDDIFSDFLIAEFDKNKDGRFDEAELAEVKRKGFDNLKEHNYFVVVRLGPETFRPDDVAGFAARIDGRLVHYRFEVHLREPVAPSAKPVRVSVYDESYFVEVLLDRNDPIRFEGVPSGICRYAIGEDKENRIYFGLIHPLQATLACPGL
ncbi:MAG: DUF1007 family protein [Alphaproteobacteria bacterium]|nr:DUF1007 family protein [Alphaproteobacteria bacterium]